MNRPHDAPRQATHTIGLASQWELEWLGASEAEPTIPSMATRPTPTQRLKKVADWPTATGGTGRVRLRRRFGRPSGLSTGERLLLRITGLPETATTQLNGRVLPCPGTDPSAPPDTTDSRMYDVSEQIADRNELVIEFDRARSPAGTAQLADVQLEIWGR